MKQFRSCTFVIGVVSLMFLCTPVAGSVSAQVPQKINYQGYLVGSGGTPVNATVQMRFAIYDVASDGNALWSETQTVTINDGRYSVVLGSVTPISLTEAKPYWLGATIGSDLELTPRKELTGTLYDVIQGNNSGSGNSPWMIDGQNIYRESGNVGIGAKPAYETALDVVKSQAGERVIIRTWNRDTTNDSSDAMLYARTEKGGGDSMLLLGLQGVVNWFIAGDRSDGSKLKIGRTGMSSIDSGNTVMTFDNSNNVGIGTSHPIAKLTLAEGNRISLDDNADDRAIFVPTGEGEPLVLTNHRAAANPTIRFRDDSTGTDKMVVNISNGDVRIDGRIFAKEIQVKTNVWADFVFDEDYDLMPLSDVEQHIKTHKHLPAVPSEQEVLENGVSLGQMQSTLLQKNRGTHPASDCPG